MSNNLGDAQVAAIVANLRTQANALENSIVATPPTPPPTIPPVIPPPTPVGDGSFPGRMSVDSNIWTKVFEDAFPVLAPKGQFLSKYPTWSGYPSNYVTTDRSGHYDPAQTSVVTSSDGRQVMQVDCGAANNVSAAMYPKVAGVGHLGMRIEQRIRIVNPNSGWHLANLLWPTSETWPRDGEIDYYETDATSNHVNAFFHLQNGTSGGDQKAYSQTINQGSWNTVAVEWMAGQYLRWFVNGQQILPTLTSRVPSTPMRLVLQIESSGDPQKDTQVQYDWITIHFPK